MAALLLWGVLLAQDIISSGAIVAAIASSIAIVFPRASLRGIIAVSYCGRSHLSGRRGVHGPRCHTDVP